VPLSQRARAAADELWAAQHRHPVVRGIADGALDLDAFRRWLRQDYVFLVDYARALSLAAARAPDVATMRGFAEVATETLGTEMDGHRAYAASFGIGEAELEAEPPSPATRAYVDFLLRQATVGDFADVVAAILPCMWGFSEVGRRLVEEGAAPADERLRAWIAMYGDPEFERLAAWCREVFDRVGDAAPADVQDRMVEVFVASSRHELAFWDQVLPAD
jgi:thiaminase (transcriptional activator TenA)